MRILLDTVAFWWVASAPENLSARAAEVFTDPANDMFLSPVSVWELLVKHQIGKLPAPRPIVELLAQARDERLIGSLSVRESAVFKLPSLPMLHRDPFGQHLFSRLGLYLRFGQGDPCGHWGGRYIWQLGDADSLEVCWKETPGQSPRDIDKAMIATFADQHGKYPYANING